MKATCRTVQEPDLEKMSAPADGRTGKDLLTAPTRRQDDQPSGGGRSQNDQPAGGSGTLFGLPENLDLKSLGKASAAIGMKLYSEVNTVVYTNFTQFVGKNFSKKQGKKMQPFRE